MNDAGAIARAYDAAAPDYDRQVAGDAWMRRILWDHYRATFHPGQRVLDVGCGTGSDAIFLARRGVRVVAIDVSTGMIARLRARVAEAGVSDLVEAHVCDFADLDAWSNERYDGIVSAFAGLNAAPDLRPFAIAAARRLWPGDHLIVHLLNHWSLWEWLGLVRRREWRRARQLGQVRERRFSVGGVEIRQYPFAPEAAYAEFFSPWFRLHRAYGLGILRPPHTVRRVPTPVARALGSIDRVLEEWPAFRGRGRLFVLDLIRRAGVVEDTPRRSVG